VGVDGSPYGAEPAKYGWVRPVYGALHEEINMSKARADIVQEVVYAEFAKTQGSTSPAALSAARDASDLHKARNLQLVFLEGTLLECT
jgi:hypothetical protein